MKSFNEIYKSSILKLRKNQFKVLKETNYEFTIIDELISDLEAAMIDILLKYRTMDLNKKQVMECIDEACAIVKSNPEI